MKWWVVLLIGAAIVLGSGMSSLEKIVEKIALAIKEFEGWKVGSRSYRNNNPGNLKSAGQIGLVGIDETGHAIFDSLTSGWNALKNQIRIAIIGKSYVYTPSDSLYEFFSKYSEANSAQYAQFVASKLGVVPETKLSELEGLL